MSGCGKVVRGLYQCGNGDSRGVYLCEECGKPAPAGVHAKPKPAPAEGAKKPFPDVAAMAAGPFPMGFALHWTERKGTECVEVVMGSKARATNRVSIIEQLLPTGAEPVQMTALYGEEDLAKATEAARREERERVLGEVLAYVTGPVRNQFVDHKIHPDGLQLKDVYDDVRELCRSLLKTVAKGQAK